MPVAECSLTRVQYDGVVWDLQCIAIEEGQMVGSVFGKETGKDFSSAWSYNDYCGVGCRSEGRFMAAGCAVLSDATTSMH